MADSFLTVAEIAELLKVNQQTVRNWIDRSELPAVHVGRRVRVKRSDFDAFIEQGYSGGRAAGQGGAGGIWDGDVPAPDAASPGEHASDA